MMKIKIAIPSKGRISEPSINILEKAGLGLVDKNNRKLISKTFNENVTDSIEITDLAGNKTLVDYSVNNIDKEVTFVSLCNHILNLFIFGITAAATARCAFARTARATIGTTDTLFTSSFRPYYIPRSQAND